MFCRMTARSLSSVNPSYNPSLGKSYQLDFPPASVLKYAHLTRSSPLTLLSRLPSPGHGTSDAKIVASFAARSSKFFFSTGPSVEDGQHLEIRERRIRVLHVAARSERVRIVRRRPVPLALLAAADVLVGKQLHADGRAFDLDDARVRLHVVRRNAGADLREVRFAQRACRGVGEIREHRHRVEHVRCGNGLRDIDAGDFAEQREKVGHVHHLRHVAIGLVQERSGNDQMAPRRRSGKASPSSSADRTAPSRSAHTSRCRRGSRSSCCSRPGCKRDRPSRCVPRCRVRPASCRAPRPSPRSSGC